MKHWRYVRLFLYAHKFGLDLSKSNELSVKCVRVETVLHVQNLPSWHEPEPPASEQMLCRERRVRAGLHPGVERCPVERNTHQVMTASVTVTFSERMCVFLKGLNRLIVASAALTSTQRINNEFFERVRPGEALFRHSLLSFVLALNPQQSSPHSISGGRELSAEREQLLAFSLRCSFTGARTLASGWNWGHFAHYSYGNAHGHEADHIHKGPWWNPVSYNLRPRGDSPLMGHVPIPSDENDCYSRIH